METLLQDVHYGFRMLRKSPAFTTVAVLTLAMGIGANTAIFSLMNALLLSSLPVRQPNELAVVGDPARAHSRSMGTPQVDLFSYPLYRELRDHNKVFSGMMASAETGCKVETEQAGLITDNATGTLVTGNYFSVLGVKAFLGRTLVAGGRRRAGRTSRGGVELRFLAAKIFPGSRCRRPRGQAEQVSIHRSWRCGAAIFRRHRG